MNIRLKLSIQFTLIVGSILLIFTVGIYFFSASYRANDYYSRLTDRAYTTARLLLDVQEVDETLLKIIDRNTQALHQEQIYIFNDSRVLLYSNSDKPLNNYALLKKINDTKVYRFKEQERDAVGIIYRYEGRNYIVVASANDIYGTAKLKNLKIILISGFLLSLLVVIVAGLVFAGRALDPISSVVSQVKKITASQLNLRVDEGNKNDEIAQLAITFNQMLQRIEEAFLLQQDFVSNAAHELRTPFSVLLAEIEYCLMQERDKAHYIKILNNLSLELKKLNKLSNSLLDLARIGADMSNYEPKYVRMDELLLDTCTDVLRVFNDYTINVNWEELPENDSSLNVLGNAQLLKIAIKNLIENACKFSEDKKVTIVFLTHDNTIILKFSDSGIGIPENDMNNIFQPFYRGINSRFISGFGLGLSLTMKIIQLHQGSIQVQSVVNQGSVFTVILPKGKLD